MEQVQLDIRTKSAASVEVNVLPCKIHYTGSANVSKFFKVEHSKADDGAEQRVAFFRGRHLKGTKVDLPDGYTGFLAKEHASPANWRHGRQGLDDDEEEDDEDEDGKENINTRHIHTTHKFNSLTVWGHEQVPERDDLWIAGVSDWISLAKSIHEA